jgi:hypothetical protein
MTNHQHLGNARDPNQIHVANSRTKLCARKERMEQLPHILFHMGDVFNAQAWLILSRRQDAKACQRILLIARYWSLSKRVDASVIN